MLRQLLESTAILSIVIGLCAISGSAWCDEKRAPNVAQCSNWFVAGIKTRLRDANDAVTVALSERTRVSLGPESWTLRSTPKAIHSRYSELFSEHPEQKNSMLSVMLLDSIERRFLGERDFKALLEKVRSEARKVFANLRVRCKK